MRYSSPYPRIVASGVRSSCEASATNRRIRASEAVRTPNACSICVSIPFSAALRRPTSVCSDACGTRCDRSPAAMAAAVTSISRRGRNDRRTAQVPGGGTEQHDAEPAQQQDGRHVPHGAR